MVWSDGQTAVGSVWELAARQHGVIARHQLLEHGLGRRAIEHRLRKGRLHPIRHRGRTWRCVYAVGRPQLTERGLFMAAVLFAGPTAILSHESAAFLWGIRSGPPGCDRHHAPNEAQIEVTLPPVGRRPTGLRVHRRVLPPEDHQLLDGIPVTSPIKTLLDLATRPKELDLEGAVNQADKLDLVDPETLRRALDARAGARGVARLRKLLDRRTFVLTDSALERKFMPLVRRAKLSRPRTGVRLNGFKVDFYWPDLGLVVETDGLRYHRTPGQQARDRRRDQAHAAAGLTALRFTHSQVAFEAEHVVDTLVAVAERLLRR